MVWVDGDPPMDLERERRIEALCAEAIELPESEVEAFLIEKCGDDAEMAEDVKDMLMWMDRPTEMSLFQDVQGDAPTLASPMKKRVWEAKIPNKIGPFHVIRKLGEGGMGQVFLCEQREPVIRQVALKLINSQISETLDEAHIALESRAMAALSHPNIAQIYEVGDTPEGLHFFAMEYVHGKPLTTYCHKRQLGLEQRLQLFINICRGVKHAHQKGVIHRDLKPSNILVTEVDGQPMPKIIDFGIATNIQTMNERDLFKTVAGTPVYMSPEVVNGTKYVGLDTRVDVYSLGIILFEILTGMKPFDTEDLTIPQILKKIADEPLLMPSERLQQEPEENQRDVAAERGFTLRRYLGQLKDDLDWITAKATAHDRDKRYDTADQLADDLQRYLRHGEVEAVPHSPTYMVRKFVRRHVLGIAGAALVTLLLFSVAGARFFEARRAQDAAIRAEVAMRQAQQVSDFLVTVLEQMDPRHTLGKEVDVSTLLSQSMDKAEETLKDQPAVRARIMLTVGSMQLKLGNPEEGVDNLHTALSILENHPPGPDLAKALVLVGGVNVDRGQFDRGQQQVEEAFRLYKQYLGLQHADTLLAQGALAELKSLLGQHQDAVSIFRDLIEGFRAVEGDDGLHVGKYLVFLGRTYMHLGEYPEAESTIRQGMPILEAHLPANHPNVLMAKTQLARVFHREAQYEKAFEILEGVVKDRREVQGEDHPVTANAMYFLGKVLLDQGRLGEAERLLVRSRDIWREAKGHRHRWSGNAQLALANLYLQQSLLDKAEAALKESESILVENYGEGHIELCGTFTSFGDLFRVRKEYPRAETYYLRALELLDRNMPANHPDRIPNLIGLGSISHHEGRLQEAADYLGRARSLCRRVLPPDHPLAIRTRALSRQLPAG